MDTTDQTGTDNDVPTAPGAGGADIAAVDPWDHRWPAVLELIDRCGGRSALEIDAAGWLPARHAVLAAFVKGVPAGHVGFHIRPAADHGHPVYNHGRAVLEAKIDCLGVDEQFRASELQHHLMDAARRRAVELHCRELL